MNAIILASVFAGAFTIFLSAEPEQGRAAGGQISAEQAAIDDQMVHDLMAATEDKGSMTQDVKKNPKTGEEEETTVLAFLD